MRGGAIEELLSKSLAMADSTGRNLQVVTDGLQAALPRESPAEWDLAVSSAASTRWSFTRPCTGQTHASNSSTEAGDCILPTIPRPSTCRTRLAGRSTALMREREVHNICVRKSICDQGELVKTLEERERALIKRTEHLEHKAQWLNHQLTQEREERRLLESKIVHLEATMHSNAMKNSKSALLRRRYHFVVDGDHLESSVGDSNKQLCYFEVKVQSADTMENEGRNSTATLAHHTRFAYSDRPYEGFVSADHRDSACANVTQAAPTMVDPDAVCLLDYLQCAVCASS